MSTIHTRRSWTPPVVFDISKLNDKELPTAYEAECALLGSMILDGQVIGEVVQILAGEEDFHQAAHQAIYRVLVQMFEHNEPVDMVPLHQKLTDQGVIDEVGGLDYLLTLAKNVPHAVNAPHYARLVREKSVLRKLITAAGKILHTAYHTADPVNEQLDLAERAVFEIAQARISGDIVPLPQLLQEAFARLEQHDGRTVTGLPTGFRELDEMTSGLQNGDMVVIAARPSMGKTALALNIAEHVGVNQRQPVAVFSLEMAKEQLAERLLSSRSKVNSQKIRKRMLGAEDFTLLHEACGELNDAPIYIDDTAGLNILTMRAKARRIQSRFGLSLVIIDYLQLMSAKAESRQQEVSVISRGVKEMARELRVPVICLSQLNRGPEAREGHKPRMSDLRESGSIEQDADVVMMLHREEYYHDDAWRAEHPDAANVAELIVAKQRNGPTGTVKLFFNQGITRFENLAAHAPGGAYSD